MPQLEYFLVAESCARDADRRTLSIFHVLNDVRLLEFPDVINEMSVVSSWIMTPAEIGSREEFQLRFEFEMPDPKDNNQFRANLTASARFQDVYLRLVGVPVTKSGDIRIRLLIDDEEKATHTISVSEFDPGSGPD